MTTQHIVILGSTGSIGQSTLDVISRHSEVFSVYALTAYSRMRKLARQALAHTARVVVVPSDAHRTEFLEHWPADRPRPEIRVGAQALSDTVSDTDVTTVMAAIVGAAGLPSALAAVHAGKRVLLANKEALVAAGALFMRAVRDNQAELIPVDSEHNAIFQCLPEGMKAGDHNGEDHGIRRLLLTASGGPFREVPLADLDNVTPEQACAHPTWKMGRKISVDSATMINKGLEVIEAHWLFDMPSRHIDVVIHPQSVVHSMVEYQDGSILAQLGQPDMRTPIAHALGFPDRIDSGVGMMSLVQMGTLDFEAPDLARFPCLDLAYQALEAGQSACITLNAANEVAVDSFLNHQIAYTAIPDVIAACLDRLSDQALPTLDSLEAILDADALARHEATRLCRHRAGV
ncbi:MAG TPA: 1-deoxy-D-xylulose-5-phosphate reductoisomerase [Burkholderiaceae bacterium]|nr:1-deoxy-D-xylulose-5-phosphate reductoisomerase [Burkholderiaceae bacterium]